MFRRPALILLTLFGIATAAGAADETDSVRALDLLHSQGCLGCHLLDGGGGTFGPAFDGVGNRLSRDRIRAKLVDPQQSLPDSRMPDSRHLTTVELDLLAAYLADRR